MGKKTPKIKTHAELAAILGVSRQIVTYHAKKSDAPKLDDVPGWMEYLGTEGREGSLPPDIRKKIGEQRLRLIKEQADRVARENKVASDELIPIDQIRKSITIAVQFYCGEIQRLVMDGPSMFVGRTEMEIRVELQKFYDSIRPRMIAEFSKVK